MGDVACYYRGTSEERGGDWGAGATSVDQEV